jgi:hypothetical protein
MLSPALSQLCAQIMEERDPAKLREMAAHLEAAADALRVLAFMEEEKTGLHSLPKNNDENKARSNGT